MFLKELYKNLETVGKNSVWLRKRVLKLEKQNQELKREIKEIIDSIRSNK